MDRPANGCAAIVVVADRSPDHASLTSLRASLGPRARAWLLLPARALADALVDLSAAGLEPKHLRVSSDPAACVLLTAAHARPGGLVVEIVPVC